MQGQKHSQLNVRPIFNESTSTKIEQDALAKKSSDKGGVTELFLTFRDHLHCRYRLLIGILQ
jgi:hypothetical protein